MRNLCDSNVLVALVTERHPHHISALTWLRELGDDDAVVLCRSTQITFLRLLTTEAVMQEEVQTNSKAIAILSGLMADSRFVLMAEEPPDLEARWFKHAGLRSASPKLWMDAYLAAFATALGLRFVTFDRGYERLRSAGLNLLLLS